MTTATKVYTLEVTNTPDGDGDFCARIYKHGQAVKTFYRRERTEAVLEARRWVSRDQGFDPGDVERIEL